MERDYDNYQYSKELAERIFCDNLNDCMEFPKYFNIGTTNFCNAECKMCPHSKENKTGQMMEEELFGKILREISAYSDWVESVAVYWYGEPLLDPHLSDRIAKLKQAGIRNIQLSTNGYGLNRERAQDIFEAGLNDLRISIDAMTKETYEKIRYGLDFNKVMKNVLDTFEIRNEKYPEIPIRIRLTEMEDNLNEIEDFIAYWEKVISKIDRVQIMPLHTKDNWDIEKSKPGELEDYPCIAPFSSMVIDADGTVPLCCLDSDRKVVIGNLSVDSIKDVWNSDLLHDIRMKHLRRGRGEVSICKNCNCWDRTFKTYHHE